MRWPTSNKQKLNPNIRTAQNAKQLPKRPTNYKQLFSKKNVAIVVIVGFTAFGAFRLFFAGAAPDNCQDVTGGRICDVDMVGGPSDTVLSSNAEAVNLGNQGWGVYYGAVFRAPTSALNGAVPVFRVYNAGATYHDWMTDPQLKGKEARYGAQAGEGIAFYAWAGPGQPDTVPVYRITRMGGSTQTFFSTDKGTIDRLLAQSANDPDGWKIDDAAPGIAFYAYPPSYTVAAQVNPYDCTIQENYLSERCAAPRKNLEEKIVAGDVPTSNECPKTLDAYNRAPFPGQFPQDCQNWWNTYMQDCSIVENFTSDRCKNQREELAREQQRQADARAQAEAQARTAARARSGNGSSRGGSGSSSQGDEEEVIETPETPETPTTSPRQAKTNAQICTELGGDFRRDGRCTAPGGVTPGNTSAYRAAQPRQQTKTPEVSVEFRGPLQGITVNDRLKGCTAAGPIILCPQ